MATVVAVVALAAIAGSGCQSGIVDSPLFSADLQVIAFLDKWHPEVYVADARGCRDVGKANHFALSRNGNYVLAIDARESWLSVGDTLTLYEVSTGRRFKTALPEVAKARDVEPDKWQWACRSPDPEVFIMEDEPGVVFGLAVGKDAGPPDPKRVYFRWRPDGGWQTVERPPERLVVQLRQHFARIPIQLLPIVEFGPDGLNARHAVWVRPDGSTVELLRNNDRVRDLAFLTAFLPTIFFNPYYLPSAGPVLQEFGTEDQARPKARLTELLAQKKKD
jgi:hypothetical protein